MSPRIYLAALALAVLVALHGPSAAARGPRLLVLNKDEATLSLCDPATGQVVGKIPTGDGPHEVVATADGKLAFASNYGTRLAPGSSISILDLVAQKELRRLVVSPLQRPHGLALARGKLYFTAEGSQSLGRYDPATGQIDWQFATGQAMTHMVLVSKDARTIFTANIGSDSLSAIVQGPGGEWTQTVIPVGKGPEGIELSPSGREVWTAHSRDGGVSIIDVASKKLVQTFAVGTKRANRLKLTPDGKFALISDLEAGDLLLLDAASRREVKRLPLGKRPEGILIAPDGLRVFVAVNGDNQVAVIDAKTWQVTSRILPGAGPDGMAWVQ